MSSLTVLLHHDVGPELEAWLAARSPEQCGGADVRWCPVGDRDRYRSELADVDVLFHVLDPVNVDVLDAAPRRRLVQKLGVGVNTIDLDACTDRRIAVCNMPGTNAPAVVEAALLLLLAALRRLPDWHERTRAGRGWPPDPELADQMGELAGRTVGLVGYGDIAQRLEPVLVALGARVVHNSRRVDRPSWLPLHELLQSADVVSIHVPLNEETDLLLDRYRIGLMKPGAVLVNTARGGVVDQGALVEALSSGRLAAAGLDVFAHEPLAPDDPLRRLDNVVLMPHVAWLTNETMRRCLEIGFENARRLAAGEPLQHRVV
jgi:phosphoglycerate dehydrogenase-like enzyme